MKIVYALLSRSLTTAKVFFFTYHTHMCVEFFEWDYRFLDNVRENRRLVADEPVEFEK